MDFTLLQHFGIKSNIAPKKLGGYDSDNYLIEDKKGNQYIFKKHLEKDIKAVVEAECELIAHLGEQIPKTFQSGIKTQEGTYLLEADGHIYRLVQYLEGDLLADVSTILGSSSQ